ncbi:hypothetical protein [Brachybacterium ginsengisoli]|nr:hypothetical protein [Brachybacterium ginsengisoli]
MGRRRRRGRLTGGERTSLFLEMLDVIGLVVHFLVRIPALLLRLLT